MAAKRIAVGVVAGLAALVVGAGVDALLGGDVSWPVAAGIALVVAVISAARLGQGRA